VRIPMVASFCIETVPESGASSPVIIFRSVDLPAPFIQTIAAF
jgi:hypothetical protein